MQSNFAQILSSFKAGELADKDVRQKLHEIMVADDAEPATQLFDQLQKTLAQGEISADQYRVVMETITQVNLELSTNSSSSPDKTEILRDDKTQLMGTPQSTAAPTTQADDKTQVLSQKQQSSLHNKTPRTQHITTGTTLKHRFVLKKCIGQGGMGIVFEAQDMVKVEARDKQPLVAVKVLTEKFKKHSSSFIALQREASKTQKLAHPNIATVYDFDHDGDTVYMTMELLDGSPFDKVIENMPADGLPTDQALNYIEQLCHGLSYAHKQNLIHSDLKPGNIFLCNNGTVKLLDFGITRAVKTETDDETIFDPSSLHALTPAYATVEMFKGKNPDPRDDIYALACVAFELVSGTHPYKKVAANKALELSLKPPRCKKLTTRQQKAFNKALSLKREDRTLSIEQFLSDLMPQKSHTKQLFIGGIIILVLAAGILFKPLTNHFKEEAQLTTIQSIKTGDQYQLEKLLKELPHMDSHQKVKLTSILRKEIITYYQNKINASIDAQNRHYDFPTAFTLLASVNELYPDSASLLEARKQLINNKTRLIKELTRRYKILKQNGGDTQRLLTILREADPENSLLLQ